MIKDKQKGGFPWKKVLLRTGQVLGCMMADLLTICLWGMIFYSGPFEQAGWANGILATLWVGAVVSIFFQFKPWRTRAIWWSAAVLMVVVPYLSISPSNDRDWEPEYARTGYSSLNGDTVTLYNVRNFVHRDRDDFDARWESRTYHLSKLRGLEYFQSNFYGDTLAHPILSFDFGNEGRICLSVETRREVGEKFTPFGGLYKMFELQYLFVTEEDCIPLRTQVREEVVRRYTIRENLPEIRKMFLSSLKIQNELATKPRFYNVIQANCTTSLRDRRSGDMRGPSDMRLLFNGMLDEYLYEHGMLETHGLAFEELRDEAIINERANAAAGHPDFSKKIRQVHTGQ